MSKVEKRALGGVGFNGNRKRETSKRIARAFKNGVSGANLKNLLESIGKNWNIQRENWKMQEGKTAGTTPLRQALRLLCGIMRAR